jgi:hypothetical protein
LGGACHGGFTLSGILIRPIARGFPVLPRGMLGGLVLFHALDNDVWREAGELIGESEDGVSLKHCSLHPSVLG